MRYDMFDEMWFGCLQRALTIGDKIVVRGRPCAELMGYQATLDDVHHNLLMNPRRRISPTYACAEILWYLSGDDSIEMIEAYAPQYKLFANDGVAYGAYGKRWLYEDTDDTQLTLAIKLLQDDPTTRQCVVCMWGPSDLPQAIRDVKRDIPCTTTWQFLVRDGALHMICTMRSNDIWLGMPYDVFANTTIMKLIALTLGVRAGTYTHQVGSLHLYEKHYAAARETVRETAAFKAPHFLAPKYEPIYNLAEQAAIAVQNEKQARERGDVLCLDGLHDILIDVVTTCATKWDCGMGRHHIKSPLLRRAIECSS